MSPAPKETPRNEAIDRLLSEVQRLESAVGETANRVKLTWARTTRGPLSAEQQRQFQAAAAELSKIRAAIERVDVEVPEPTVSDEERDRLIAELQALFSHIPPGVSLADELIADRRREAERESLG